MFRRDQSYFGTLCALDSRPTQLNKSHLQIFHLLANLIAFQLEAEDQGRKLDEELRATREMGRIRERFIGILGHDLRSPLNAILLGADALQRDPDLSPPNAQMAALMASSAQRMSHMIGETLDLTRGRLGGGIPVSPAPANMNEICRHVIGELRVQHSHRALELIAAHDARGEFDAPRAAQVVSNLVSNALRYGDADSPVGITVRNDDEYVTVAIHNAGPAIPAAVQEAIFDPFRRASQLDEKSGDDGLGLGLYIAREILSAHGGGISLESDKNGTTFTTRWPRSAALVKS